MCIEFKIIHPSLAGDVHNIQLDFGYREDFAYNEKDDLMLKIHHLLI